MEGAAEPGHVQLRPVDAGSLGAVPPGRLVSPAQRLEHPDPRGRVLDVGRQVALLILGAAGEHPVAPLEPEARGGHRQEHAAGQQAEPPVQADEQRGDGQEGDHVGDEEDGAEAGEPADRRQVGGGARQQLAGLPGAVKAGVQVLQVRVDVVPHGKFHAGHGAGLHPSPDHVERRLGRAERDRPDAKRDEQHAVAVRDRPVDHRLGDQRDHDLGGDRPEGAAEHRHQLPPVRPQVLAGTPQRLERRLAAGGMRKLASWRGGHLPQASQRVAVLSPGFRSARHPHRNGHARRPGRRRPIAPSGTCTPGTWPVRWARTTARPRRRSCWPAGRPACRSCRGRPGRTAAGQTPGMSCSGCPAGRRTGPPRPGCHDGHGGRRPAAAGQPAGPARARRRGAQRSWPST